MRPAFRALKRLTVPGLLWLALAGCGGGGSDSDAYLDAVAAADKKEAEARAAAALQPCAEVAQCSLLEFQATDPRNCTNWSYKPYSVVSPTAAAASAAAAEQQVLARKALSLAPPTNIACPAVMPPKPVLSCVANACNPA